MKKYFIIEFGGKKELHEMTALELVSIQDAIDWIQGSMDSDEEYFNIDIKCEINLFKPNQALVCVNYETIVTQEMFQSEVYSVEDIITGNLSVVSKIITRMVEK